MAGSETLAFDFALKNSATGKYLTAETFGFRINVNGTVCKRKQIFTLEPHGDSDKVFIRTPHGRYLTTTAAGEFGGDAESPGADELFEINAQSDGTWALKSAHGYWAGGQGEKVDAYVKPVDGGAIPADRLWTVQLAMHPQINMRSVNRKTFVHLSEGVLTTDEVIPWGDDALLTLTFFEVGTGGFYGIQASNGQFLSHSGVLKANPDAECHFIIEFHRSKLAFKSPGQKYLTSVGAKGALKASKERPGPDEFFTLQDSHPQMKLKASNGKRVSVRTGVEVSANQAEVTDAELFQMELSTDGKWSFRTHKDMFWSLASDGGVHSNSKSVSGPEKFDVDWMDDKMAIKASNGKYVSIKKNGALVAVSDAPGGEAAFVWEMINRPKLVLRGEHGFVGTLPSGLVECNKSTPEVFNMHISGGKCHISGQNGKYWKVEPNGAITVTGSSPTDMFLEFVEPSKLMIKVADSGYLQGKQNGEFKVSGSIAQKSTLWEF
jgi:fascin 1/2